MLHLRTDVLFVVTALLLSRVYTGLDEIVNHGMENDRSYVVVRCTLRAKFIYGILIYHWGLF